MRENPNYNTAELSEEPVKSDDRPPRSYKLRLKKGETPVGALRWTDPDDCRRVKREWRSGVIQRWCEHSRVLRVAWVLEGLLFLPLGYAYPGNPFLSAETGIASDGLERALKVLHDEGAIIRAHVGVQRRIYPATAIIPATVTGGPSRYGERKSPVTMTGYNTKKGSSVSYTALTARFDAELRERKERARDG